MITWEEVMKLRQLIPPRYPRGDTRNLLRIGPERRFSAAVRRYQQDHGIAWHHQPGRDYNQPRR